jgi:hypothetical protein
MGRIYLPTTTLALLVCLCGAVTTLGEVIIKVKFATQDAAADGSWVVFEALPQFLPCSLTTLPGATSRRTLGLVFPTQEWRACSL